MFKVWSTKRGRIFATIEEARRHAADVFARRGVVVAITAHKVR